MFDDWHSDAFWHNLREKNMDPHGDKYRASLPGNDFVGQCKEDRKQPSILEQIKQLFHYSNVATKENMDLCNRVARLERAVGLGPKD